MGTMKKLCWLGPPELGRSEIVHQGSEVKKLSGEGQEVGLDLEEVVPL